MPGSFQHHPPLIKLILLFTAVLFFGTINTYLMSLLANPCFGVDITSIESMQNNISFMQLFQISQSISLFVLPSLLAFYFFYKPFKTGITGYHKISWSIIIFTIAIIGISQPFISFSGWLNHQLELPDNMQQVQNWMTQKEYEVKELTISLIRYDNWLQVSITILMMSILPAIGEEWLFRGLLQRELTALFKNKHVAIIVTAILFSAIHMQFFTFLPRFFLGIILGYLFVLSGHLWLPVIGHFVNNFMAIAATYYLLQNGNKEPLDIPFDNPFGAGVVVSFSAIIFLLYLIRIRSKAING
ncbi:CPBP family intramembrane metalloprotease [Carboxylicivirga sediminis]|uniref:CPBP family intramembrane metalloprotease n=1 Tax=Carboxylicivirga sediminis TaxID=2006564 RepID=A0A941IWB9_9BACT|nr:CPBP family intramembrane glutamic endopeptidase [Carboxylicivirga sediminis]MBR8535065.1 CPBP family intramembrane metalloprotease [Carboxylicivirga sediminis]